MTNKPDPRPEPAQPDKDYFSTGKTPAWFWVLLGVLILVVVLYAIPVLAGLR